MSKSENLPVLAIEEYQQLLKNFIVECDKIIEQGEKNEKN